MYTEKSKGDETAPLVKVPAAMPDNPNLIPGTHIELTTVCCPLTPTYVWWCMHSCTCTLTRMHARTQVNERDIRYLQEKELKGQVVNGDRVADRVQIV